MRPTRCALVTGVQTFALPISWTAGAGASLITDGGNLGVSFSRYDSLYGVPNRYSVEPEDHDHEEEGEEEHHEHGNVRIDMRQTRVDVRGEVRMGGFLDSLRVRAGFADYRHDELEETGEIGTTFRAEGWEGRAELVQADRGGWKGALGAQLMLRSMSIVGEEKFLPRHETQQYRSEEHTSELQSLMRTSYAVFCLNKKN